MRDTIEQDEKEWAEQSKWLYVNTSRRPWLARRAVCLKHECCVLMPNAIESSCWASRLPPHVLFAARLPGRPSDFREEKSTHMTRGKKNSVGDLNACMSVLALQWKDTHVVNIIELFLYFNRLGYKQFVRKRESFCEKCFCACVCDWPPSVGEDYYLIIRQACSIWSPLKRKNNRGRAGHKRESWRGARVTEQRRDREY